MKKANALVMNYEDFEELIDKASNEHAGVGLGARSWFYVSDDDYDIKNINNDLSRYIGVNVIAVRIDMSVNEDDVIIIYE